MKLNERQLRNLVEGVLREAGTPLSPEQSALWSEWNSELVILRNTANAIGTALYDGRTNDVDMHIETLRNSVEDLVQIALDIQELGPPARRNG